MESVKIKRARQLFIAALESNLYKQNFGALRKDNTYCAGGVACDIYRQCGNPSRWTKIAPAPEYYKFEVIGASWSKDVPPEVYEWLGENVLLEKLNDSKLSFKDIATRLKHRWKI